MKFAVKVHNEYLSEAVQKLAFDNGYRWYHDDRAVVSTAPINNYRESAVLLFGESKLINYYWDNNLEALDALTDWQKIEEAMKPKVPRVIWVYECEKYDPNPVILSEEVAKSKVEKGCITCKATKFQEVIE